MNELSNEIEALVAREKIRDCVARVARGEDRRDAGIIRTCYWPDANCDFGIFSGSFEDYLAWVVPGSDAVLLTQHFLGQSVIEVDDEQARCETQVMSYHRIDMGVEERDVTIGGRYLDQMAKRGTEWRIIQRTMLYDWCQDSGISADWSQGVMGTPFSGDHYTGRVGGDYSEQFMNLGD